MKGILVFIEQREGKLNRVSYEAIVAGQRLAQTLSQEVSAVVVGFNISDIATEVATKQLSTVYSVEHELLSNYTPDGFALAMKQAVEQLEPLMVIFPHTYLVRDFAPKLAASLGKSMVGDCISYKYEDGRLRFVRQIFQGKINADVSITDTPPYFVSFQSGAYRGDDVITDGAAPIVRLEVTISPEQIRIKPLELFREAKQSVDLTQSKAIVAVGRGIKSAENIVIAEKLAAVLGADLAASRPICDNGWLPMDRQIGSSGQTVAPKLYVALGISGAIQHVVGMKNSSVIVAINKDANAPIFDIADFGIVGDLFEVVPALTEELQKLKEG
ncbi:MAG: electron transfer flavoprotein subunit alpha/FixB family protein [Acidobacteriota bacterium]|nr:electron transfer flavoprotein subunit alpha/FixB family protein [Blastocatellia bacterium]MDW8412961.1 electron transfer flavoprotein subunit alpha/FixB family protein [Acidobacteriota bacterium]